MALATSQLSVLILSSYVTLAELGRYSIALKLSLIVSYPLIIMNAITAPRYANLYEQNHLHSFKGLALTSTRLLFCLGSVGVITHDKPSHQTIIYLFPNIFGATCLGSVGVSTLDKPSHQTII